MLAATSVAAASTAPARTGHVMIQPGGLARHLSSPAGKAGIRHATSSNWSGYAVHHGTYNSVSASWTEPTGHCSSGSQYSSFWVGLDGYSSQTVEQTGTDVDCHGRTPSYYGWYEMFPAASVRISRPVKPGDRMRASVTYNGGGNFTLTLTDSTQGWTATEHKSLVAATRSSAEVIIEAPSSFTGELPLADFGTAKFTAATVDGSTIGSLNPTKITMVVGGRQLDKISALTGGTSFTGKWLAS
jgi:hypothetical protein